MGWYIDIFVQAWRQLHAYALRSVLTALGIVIAVTGVITVAGVMAGLQSGVNRELAELGAETIMLAPNFRKAMDGKNLEYLGWREWQMLQRIPGIATPVASINVRSNGAQSKLDATRSAPKVVGVSDQFPDLYRQVPLHGRFLLPSDESGHLRVCVIGDHMVERLRLPPDAVLGSTIRLGVLALRVVGVMPANGDRSGSAQQFGDIYVPLSVADELNARESGMQLAFRLRDPSQREHVLRDLSQRLRQTMGTAPNEEDDFRIEDAAQIRRTNDAIIGMVSLVLVLVVSVALLVGGVGIMNVMLVSVTERTREIGVLRALGATRRHIRLQFLTEAALLSALGAFVGVILGWGLASLIVLVIPNAQGAVLPLWAVVASVGGAILVGLVAGAVPAMRAANLDPVLALAAE